MGAATVIAGAAVVAGAAKAISGAKQKRDGKRAARRFKRQKQKNVHEGRRVSTLGADLAIEENARATASTVEALRSGGVRGSAGGAAGVVGANNANARNIGANLDRQQLEIDRAIAADEQRIQAVQEGRDNAELSNIQQQINAGNQQFWSGLGDVAQGVGGITSAGGGGGGGAGIGSGAGGANPTYNSKLGAAKNSARTAFGNVGGAFGGTPINPITGLPYGQ